MQVDAQPQPEMPRTGENWEGEDMQLVCHELQTYVSIIEREVETVDRMNSQSQAGSSNHNLMMILSHVSDFCDLNAIIS